MTPDEAGDNRVGDGRVGDGRVGDGRVGDGRVGDGRVGDGRIGDGRGGDGGDHGEIAKVPNGEEAWRLIDAAIDGPLPPEDRRRLEQLVVEQPAIARLCIRTVHLWYGLQLHMRQAQSPEALLGHLPTIADDDERGIGMHETMILPAVHAGTSAEAEEEVFRPQLTGPLPIAPRRWRRQAALAAAAVLALSGVALWSFWPNGHRGTVAVGGSDIAPNTAPNVPSPVSTPATAPTVEPPPAVLTATAGAVVEGPVGLTPGTPIARDGSFRITAGAVELTFNSGAVVVVSAPSSVRVVDRNTLALDAGSVAAHVPHSALGFGVVASGLSVVDRGTNFGVRAAGGDAPTEMAVFDGIVDATPLAVGGQATAPPVRVTAGHAVSRAATAPGGTLVDAAYNPGSYTRDIDHVRVPLKLHGTGVGLPPASDDPFWLLQSVPDDPAFVPRPASIARSFSPNYARNAPGGQWISVAPDLPDSAGGNFVFRNVVDLTGFDPATAEISARVAADDEVVAVRVNGVDCGLSTPTKRAFYPLALPGRVWHAGVNQVEVVVGNGPVSKKPHARPNAMGLSWVWVGSASPIVHR